MSDVSSDLLTSLLKQVSRSFYLTLRILPKEVRAQIGLAYLLARTTDTIADTEILPVDDRLAALTLLRDRIAGTLSTPVHFQSFAERQSSNAEKVILLRCEESLRVLNSFGVEDQRLIREVLRIIISGQELDLKRFSGASEGKIVAFQNSAELDDYTYRVAGCVGEFWTKMCRKHLFPDAPLDDSILLQNGIRFGQGLQLVNILRDLPRDLRQGRCYLPQEELVKATLSPSDLLKSETEARFRPIYDRHLAKADAHLAAGWTYTISLPRRQSRVRLACAWPILIGVETTKKLRRQNPLDPAKRIKVSRSETRSILIRSILLLPFSSKWEQMGRLETSFGK